MPPKLKIDEAKAALLNLLQKKSVFHGDFTLSSGAKSNYYIDCRLTTFDPEGAWLVGQLMHSLIRNEQTARKVNVVAVGGLTMGAGRTGRRDVFALDERRAALAGVLRAQSTQGPWPDEIDRREFQEKRYGCGH